MAFVNVSDAGETVPSVISFDVIPIMTLAEGRELSLTVNVAVCPAPRASVVVNPLVGLTVNPATSLSLFVTDTSAGFMAL